MDKQWRIRSQPGPVRDLLDQASQPRPPVLGSWDVRFLAAGPYRRKVDLAAALVVVCFLRRSVRELTSFLLRFASLRSFTLPSLIPHRSVNGLLQCPAKIVNAGVQGWKWNTMLVGQLFQFFPFCVPTQIFNSVIVPDSV